MDFFNKLISGIRKTAFGKGYDAAINAFTSGYNTAIDNVKDEVVSAYEEGYKAGITEATSQAEKGSVNA